ncbi:uncharacterized protein SCHCODRAFT_02625443 [Schizophyllum commune H4-8]|nr:uncharacterized protein SCHCODRAFT_02625443 [Schizophyllum commune H4-8]KAI5892158.1 hypothetical protein SCHCODRAFT_02625443 [Schizophyllum commune H4-8]
MFFRVHILLVAFVLLLVAMVDAAPVKGLKQFKLKRGDATPLRRDNQALPSRAIGAEPSLWRRTAKSPQPSARWTERA